MTPEETSLFPALFQLLRVRDGPIVHQALHAAAKRGAGRILLEGWAASNGDGRVAGSIASQMNRGITTSPCLRAAGESSQETSPRTSATKEDPAISVLQ